MDEKPAGFTPLTQDVSENTKGMTSMLNTNFNFLMKFFVLVLSATLFVGIVRAESLSEKFIMAEIAVKLKEDGHITDEIHHLRFSCFEGECEINTMVVNRCIELNGKKSQSIFSFVEKSTDPNSTFKIDGKKIDVTIESHDFGGKTLTTYHFELGEKKIGGYKVVNFSGGYLKDSNITKSLIKVEFIPLIGEYQKINLTCPIEMPGLIKPEEP
jgi:hypothetical protein